MIFDEKSNQTVFYFAFLYVCFTYSFLLGWEGGTEGGETTELGHEKISFHVNYFELKMNYFSNVCF